MRLLLLFLMLFFISACNKKGQITDNSQSIEMGQISKEGLSEMKFINKRFDFGDVSNDTLLIADFNFVNIGNNDLIIKYVNPDCTCTGFFLSNDTICPGDTAIIQLQLNTEDKHGFVKIYSTVRANTLTRFYKLTLTANVN